MAYSFGGGRIMSSQEAQGRNTNSIMANWVDRGPWLYYDSITIVAGAAGAAQYSPFSIPIGSQDSLTTLTKNKLQTNMVRGNQFPPPKCLLLAAIGFYFDSNWIKSDIDLFLTNYYQEFRIDEKIFHEGYLWMYPSGSGLVGATTQTGEECWTNGLQAPGYQRRYGDWSKYIAPLQQFSMTLNFQQSQNIGSAVGTAVTSPPTFVNGGVVRVFLDGLTDRSVQ